MSKKKPEPHPAPSVCMPSKRWRPRSETAGRVEDRLISLLDRVAEQGHRLEPQDLSWGGCLSTGR